MSILDRSRCPPAQADPSVMLRLDAGELAPIVGPRPGRASESVGRRLGGKILHNPLG